MRFEDQKCYQFNNKDRPDRCFTCGQAAERLLVVRQVADRMLIHLCPDCMAGHVDEYLLDNTRPWCGGK
jgi:hypothetical protein